MKTPPLLLRTGLLGLLWAAPAGLRAQSTVTVTNTQLQSNFNGATGAGQTAPIAAQPFTFTMRPAYTSILSVSITLTAIDGDTGLGPNGVVDTPYPPPGDGTQFGDDDFDVNSLSLRLNNIDLGRNLLLNGLNSYDNSAPVAASDFVTITVTGTPDNAAALLAAFNTGSLTALIYDSTGVANSNGFELPNTLIDHTTPLNATLSITGTVPEPAAVFWLATGGAVLVYLGHRRRRA